MRLWFGKLGLVAAIVLATGCDESSGDGGGGLETTTPPPKKTGGFSAGLAQDLKKGSDAKVDDIKVGDASGDAKAGDAKAGDAKAGDAKAGDAKAGDAKAGDAKAGDAKAGDAKAGDAKAGDAKAGDAKAGDAKAGDAKAGDAKAGDAKVATNDAKKPDPKAGDAKAGDTKAGDAKAGDAKAGTPPPPGKAMLPVNLTAPRVAVKPSAELAAIKMSLEPNWDRDVGEAGTISLVVKMPGTDKTQVFAFRYGIEDSKAPTDREAYKRWLAENGILKAGDKPVLDRQRGGSWYLEGVDGSGAPVFRIVVVYGGKRLICGGSLYRDAQSNQLGDIRDKTITQAKQICETLAL